MIPDFELIDIATKIDVEINIENDFNTSLRSRSISMSPSISPAKSTSTYQDKELRSNQHQHQDRDQEIEIERDPLASNASQGHPRPACHPRESLRYVAGRRAPRCIANFARYCWCFAPVTTVYSLMYTQHISTYLVPGTSYWYSSTPEDMKLKPNNRIRINIR